eukprot:m.37896 g.37896  ORF g.37896 m.37896 type:complete len:167 (-) comp17778_c0_seq1:1083-1583(-)
MSISGSKITLRKMIALAIAGVLSTATAVSVGYKQPLLKYIDTIAYDSNANVRDPSSVIQDPKTGKWHFWVDWMPGSVSPGWDAYLRHYSAPNITGPWLDEGFALNHSTNRNAWDYAGQFSSSALYDKDDKTWWLFYSASGANQSTLLTNAQIICSSLQMDHGHGVD